jgi:hypothetical protein
MLRVFNPMTKDMPEQQKEILRAIHKQYGAFAGSPLTRVIQQGEQTMNLSLN